MCPERQFRWKVARIMDSHPKYFEMLSVNILAGSVSSKYAVFSLENEFHEGISRKWNIERVFCHGPFLAKRKDTRKCAFYERFLWVEILLSQKLK